MAQFYTVADAASRNFFVEEQYKEGRDYPSFRRYKSLPPALAVGKAMCSQRLTHLRARNKNRFQNCWLPDRMSNMKAMIGGTSVD
jgi:hypothetical protein